MDYNELLFAAEVRELAGRIKNSKAGEYWASLEGDSERNEKREEWLKAHPANEFIPEALSRIEETAEIIRKLRPAKQYLTHP